MLITEMIEQLADDLKSYATTDSICGEPMEIQGATIVPDCRMSVGYGGGGGEGGEGLGGDKRSSGGAVGGVKIEPAGLIVAKAGEVSVVAITNKEPKFDSLLEMIPDTIEKLTENKGGGGNES